VAPGIHRRRPDGEANKSSSICRRRTHFIYAGHLRELGFLGAIAVHRALRGLWLAWAARCTRRSGRIRRFWRWNHCDVLCQRMILRRGATELSRPKGFRCRSSAMADRVLLVMLLGTGVLLNISQRAAEA